MSAHAVAAADTRGDVQLLPSAIELRGEPFLWYKDLSAPDAIVSWISNIPFISSTFGNHISLFCLLMTVVNIIYTHINMQSQPGGNSMPGMKWMMYLMPVMFLFFFNNYAAGLSCYYFLFLLITILQTYLFRKFVDEEKVRATMRENAKKPRKKGFWYKARGSAETATGHAPRATAAWRRRQTAGKTPRCMNFANDIAFNLQHISNSQKMLNNKIQDALNAQINAELWSAYLYLSMSMHFQAEGRNGIANWFAIQFKEEQAHAQIFMNYINQRGGRVVLKPIDAVPTEWASPLAAFEHTLQHENKVTALINDLFALAEQEKDYATRDRLAWFVSEQVEEEDNCRTLIDKFKLVGDNGMGLYMLDQELAARTYTAPRFSQPSDPATIAGP